MARAIVGNVEVISLSDLSRSLPLNQAFPSVAEAKWERYTALYPNAIANGTMTGPVCAFVLKTPGETVLVDMGIGPGPFQYLGGATGGLLKDMEAARVDPASVGTVIFTHLHSDHVGWAIVNGRALCSKARYLAPEGDWASLGEPRFGRGEPLKALHDSGQLELVSGNVQVTEAIRLVPTPGHTPGHQSVTIDSNGESGIIAGDVAVCPACVEETDWPFAMDSDPEMAIETRRAMMSRLEANGALAGFGHFPEPSLGRVSRQHGIRVFISL